MVSNQRQSPKVLCHLDTNALGNISTFFHVMVNESSATYISIVMISNEQFGCIEDQLSFHPYYLARERVCLRHQLLFLFICCRKQCKEFLQNIVQTVVVRCDSVYWDNICHL